MTGTLLLDRARRRLFHDSKLFDPAERRWSEAADIAGEPVGLREAVRWLQRDSGTPCRVPVAVIGPRAASEEERQAALALGAGLAGLGIVLLCGGKGGVMEAACEGAATAGGLSVGLLPDTEWQAANRFVTIPLATGAQRDHRARRLGSRRDRRRLWHLIRNRSRAAVRPPGADPARPAAGRRGNSDELGGRRARRRVPDRPGPARLKLLLSGMQRNTSPAV
jgi:hypothetical protein